MRIVVKPLHEPEREYSLPEVNELLHRGKLDGEELAWTPGLADWTRLKHIDGVNTPSPPPLPPAFIEALPSSGSKEDPVENLQSPEKKDGSSSEKKDPAGPYGVGGWLRFFCLILTVFSPMGTFGAMMEEWREAQAAFEAFPGMKTAVVIENIGIATITMVGFVIGIMIQAGSRRGKSLAQFYLRLRFFGYVALQFVVFSLLPDLPESVEGDFVLGAFANALIIFFYVSIWGLYFERSKRIRNTYGS